MVATLPGMPWPQEMYSPPPPTGDVWSNEDGGGGTRRNRVETHDREKILLKLQDLHEFHLPTAPTRITINSCMKGLVKLLLEMTNSQWIICNITKCHYDNGTIKLKEQVDMLMEIKKQFDLG